MLVVRDREAGNIIERVQTKQEGLDLIKQYEEEDKVEGTYTEDFYEVVELENTIMHLGNIIQLTEDGDYRPNRLIINGEAASMTEYAKFHDGKNWKSTASGNVLFYRAESGKEYEIPQGKLRG